MVVEITGAGGSGKFVQKVGDTMTGDLEFLSPTIGIILESSAGSVVAGNPIGLLLALTYSGSIGTITRWRVTVNNSGALVTTAI